MIPASFLGLKNPAATDREGRIIFDGEYISMFQIANRKITVLDFVNGVKTKHGNNQTAISFKLDGELFKTVTGSSKVINILHQLKDLNVTLFETVILQDRKRYYSIDIDKTNILEINNRQVTECDGTLVYTDTGEIIQKGAS